MAGLTACAAVLALGAGACGGDDEEDVRTAIRDVQQAFADSDMRGVCELLTPAGRRHVAAMGHAELDVPPPRCPEQLRMLHDGVREGGSGWRERTRREVTGVAIDGERATATVEFGEGSSGRVLLAKDGDEWRVDGLFGGISAERQEDNW